MSKKYGAPKKENPRVHRVTAMLTADELALLDVHRGSWTRSSFARDCILSRIPQKTMSKPSND